MRAVFLAASAFLIASGCYLSHEPPPGPPLGRDAGIPPPPPPPPPPPVDAGPSEGRWWTLDPVAVTFQLRCQYPAGTSAPVRVIASASSPCQHPGPIEVFRRPGNTWQVRAHVWTEHGAVCPAPMIGSFEQDVRLDPVAVGEHVVADELSGTAVRFTAYPTPKPDCAGGTAPNGDMCTHDCQCQSRACSPIFGDAICASFCSIPCTTDLECPPGNECAPDGWGGAACGLRAENQCATPLDCAAGFVCETPDEGASYCTWTALPIGPSPCRTDTDCEPGVSCIESDGARACGIRCASATMLCPGGLVCQRSSFGGGPPWACGFWEG